MRECWKEVKEKLEGLGILRGKIYVSRISKEKPVYKITAKNADTVLILKFFNSPFVPEKEFKSLEFLYYELKFNSGNYRVPKPYFYGDSNDCYYIAEDFVDGKDLDHYLDRGILNPFKYYGKLLGKLSQVANWLSKLHTLTYSDISSSKDQQFNYMNKLILSLKNWDGFRLFEDRIVELVDKWKFKICGSDFLFSCIVHGDATPTNFIIKGDVVYAIDLERMKRQHPLWDVGFICSEIKHYYMWKGKNSYDAEPVVSHFFRVYSDSFGRVDFKLLSDYLPFFMAMGYLRISRNPWLHDDHRMRLLEEAINCLKYGL